jgi:hypothetical protein
VDDELRMWSPWRRRSNESTGIPNDPEDDSNALVQFEFALILDGGLSSISRGSNQVQQFIRRANCTLTAG